MGEPMRGGETHRTEHLLSLSNVSNLAFSKRKPNLSKSSKARPSRAKSIKETGFDFFGFPLPF
jgi:hypothetical protein